jgi:hypothetical protein
VRSVQGKIKEYKVFEEINKATPNIPEIVSIVETHLERQLSMAGSVTNQTMKGKLGGYL